MSTDQNPAPTSAETPAQPATETTAPPIEYVVPVDAMDDLQCDSCQ